MRVSYVRATRAMVQPRSTTGVEKANPGGDGTTTETHTAGAAYPAKDVVYRYQHAHVTVQHHVEIVWTARWSLNGGPYQDVPGTVTTVGPETPLQVAEATPALSGYGH